MRCGYLLHPFWNPGHGTNKETTMCCTLSTYTHGVLDERGGQRSHAASPQHSLSIQHNNLTNSDSLVEFFLHPCKFLRYSISFSFNKIKFLLSPKIHDYSLTSINAFHCLLSNGFLFQVVPSFFATSHTNDFNIGTVVATL